MAFFIVTAVKTSNRTKKTSFMKRRPWKADCLSAALEIRCPLGKPKCNCAHNRQPLLPIRWRYARVRKVHVGSISRLHFDRPRDRFLPSFPTNSFMRLWYPPRVLHGMNVHSQFAFISPETNASCCLRLCNFSSHLGLLEKPQRDSWQWQLTRPQTLRISSFSLKRRVQEYNKFLW
jgi:hypothetical protein